MIATRPSGPDPAFDYAEFRVGGERVEFVTASPGMARETQQLVVRHLLPLAPSPDAPVERSVIYQRMPARALESPAGVVLLTDRRQVSAGVRGSAPAPESPASPGSVTAWALTPHDELAARSLALEVCRVGLPSLAGPIPPAPDVDTRRARSDRPAAEFARIAQPPAAASPEQLNGLNLPALLIALVSRFVEQPDVRLLLQLDGVPGDVPAAPDDPPQPHGAVLAGLFGTVLPLFEGLSDVPGKAWNGSFATYLPPQGLLPARRLPRLVFRSNSSGLPRAGSDMHEMVAAEHPVAAMSRSLEARRAAELLVSGYLDGKLQWSEAFGPRWAARGLPLRDRIAEVLSTGVQGGRHGAASPSPERPFPPPPRAPSARPARIVPCPICLHDLAWDDLVPHAIGRRGGDPEPIHLAGAGPLERRQKLQNAVVVCPNEVDGQRHVLPLEYGGHGRPVVIGLVGRSTSGKSHLLAALIKALDETQRAREFGIERCLPVDPVRHEIFHRSRVVPLFVSGRPLPGTREGLTSFADAFVLTRRDGSRRVVAIFDVAGGDLERVQDHKEFLYIVDGLIFLVDPTALAEPSSATTGNLAFSAVLDLLGTLGRQSEVAAAVTLVKSDLLRFEEPVDFWLRQPVSLDPAAIAAETCELHEYLRSRGAHAWLRPWAECRRATLHAVSATGGPVSCVDNQEIFSRGVAQQRVLAPFLALLAMTGVLSGPELTTVGEH